MAIYPLEQLENITWNEFLKSGINSLRMNLPFAFDSPWQVRCLAQSSPTIKNRRLILNIFTQRGSIIVIWIWNLRKSTCLNDPVTLIFSNQAN